MARARSPDSIEAEKLYKEGMLLVDIAKKLGKPEGTVRRWKSTQNWDGESKGKKGERSGKKKANARKSPGGQKGNKNAVGHGGTGPPGNKNALKHGGYSQIYWDTLDEDEKALIEDMPQDEEELLINQIMLFTVRERRLMKAINKYKDAKGGVYVYGVTKNEEKRSFKNEEEWKDSYYMVNIAVSKELRKMIKDSLATIDSAAVIIERRDMFDHSRISEMIRLEVNRRMNA